MEADIYTQYLSMGRLLSSQWNQLQDVKYKQELSFEKTSQHRKWFHW